jgi:signal transduction histidine kinase
MPIAHFVFRRYRFLISQQDDLIIKTRIKLLLVCLVAFTALFSILIVIYAFQYQNFLLIRAIACVILFTIGLILLFSQVSWKVSAHFFIVCLTLLIWSNTLLFVPSVSMITVQFSVLVLAGAYYIIGAKWGVIYSLISILPLISGVLLENYSNHSIALRHLTFNKQAYALTVCFNFALLLYIHYSFFRALSKSATKEKYLRENLQKALHAAEELALAKTNFLTTMSHELRTPLNAVVGMTNILLMENPKPSQKENLNILRFSADNLMATVNDILDFNKINNEKIILEKRVFAPAELLANIVAAFRPEASQKKLKLDYYADEGLTGLNVLGDPMRLTQILFQLVGNAIKFTTKGFILIEVGITSRGSGTVSFHFSVTDSGIGIPAEIQDRIFEPFTNSFSRTSRQFHGTLGLTIAFHLVRLHESELRFESHEGEGSKFEFELTYPITDLPAIAESFQVISTIAGMRVLVVEDEKLNVLVMSKILSGWKIIPHLAVDGQQAVNAVIAHDYDVILMDINMPVMDGFEASRQIRLLPQNHKATIPIIAVTASVGAAMELIEQYPFIDDCLLKPFEPEHLREKLMEIAGRNTPN